MCPDRRRAATAQAVALLLLAATPAALTAQWLAPAPMTARSGTVLVYRTVGGEVLEDSLVESSSDRVVLVRRPANAGRLTEAPREIRRATDGYRLRDASGEQLFTPFPWPQTREWESTYRGTPYRYTHLGSERITVESGSYTAEHLQLAIGEPATLVDLWVVHNLGIVRRTTRGGGLPSDYELESIRNPPAPVVAQSARASEPPRSAPPANSPQPQPRPPAQTAAGNAPSNSTSNESSAEVRFYIAGGGWWFDREISRRAQETDDMSMGLLGWHLEGGVAGPIGLRARYAEADEQFTEAHRRTGIPASRIRLVTAELLVTALSGAVGRVYLGGGAQWTADRRMREPQWTTAAIGTLGLDTGIQSDMSLYVEMQWASGGIPIHMTLLGPERRGGGMFVVGVRVH